MRWDARPSDDRARSRRSPVTPPARARASSMRRTTPLAGGFVSKSVERLDAQPGDRGGQAIAAAFVRKTCPAREVRALELVAAMPAQRPAPSWSPPGPRRRPEDPDASGFVSPFYPGETLHFGDPIPAGVLITLARVHAAAAADAGARLGLGVRRRAHRPAATVVRARAGRFGALQVADARPPGLGGASSPRPRPRRRCARRPTAAAHAHPRRHAPGQHPQLAPTARR